METLFNQLLLSLIKMPKIKKISIPPFNIPDKPLKGRTQDLIPVLDIIDDVIIYKDGGAAIILESTSLNFGLLSEQEQEAVVASFAALINSLSFSTQILVKTEKKDISNYLNYLKTAMPQNANEKFSKLQQSYVKFISETIKKRKVLGKRFFIIIPFSPIELGLSKSSPLKKQKTIPFAKDYVIKKAKTTLYPRRDHLIKQSARLGLKLTVLEEDDIVKLLYKIYNPDPETIKLMKTEKEAELAEM